MYLRKGKYEPNSRSAEKSRRRACSEPRRRATGANSRWRGVACHAGYGVAQSPGSCGSGCDDAGLWQPIQRGYHAGSLPPDGMEAGSRHHAVYEWRRQQAGYGRVPHLAFAPVSHAREDDAEETAGDQRPAKRRQVLYLLESGTGTGAAARPPRPPHRRRPSWPAFAPHVGNHGRSRIIRVPAGQK